MKKSLLFPFILIFFSYFVIPASGTTSYKDTVKRVSPALVNISSSGKVEAGGLLGELLQGSGLDKRVLQTQSFGSGFLIDSQGHIATNWHTIQGMGEIKVTLNEDESNRTYSAKVIAFDENSDTALLKIEREKPFKFLTFADSEKLESGDVVLACGNPTAILAGSFSLGIVSAKRSFNTEYTYVQTDAAVNIGSSGGPLVDLDGKVVGMNGFMLSNTGGNQGLGFAIASEDLEPILSQLKNRGKVFRGRLGILIMPLNDSMIESLGLDGKVKSGVPIVSKVQENSSAERAGIKEQDIIYSFDGQKVLNSKELHRRIRESFDAKERELVVLRKEGRKYKEIELKTIIGEKSMSIPAKNDKKLLGVAFRDVSEHHENLEVGKGVIITAIEDDSVASETFLQEKDIVTHLNHSKINSLKEFEMLFKEARELGRKNILLTVLRNKNSFFVSLPISR